MADNAQLIAQCEAIAKKFVGYEFDVFLYCPKIHIQISLIVAKIVKNN